MDTVRGSGKVNATAKDTSPRQAKNLPRTRCRLETEEVSNTSRVPEASLFAPHLHGKSRHQKDEQERKPFEHWPDVSYIAGKNVSTQKKIKSVVARMRRRKSAR
ncbi:MAG: hypothetical protein R3C24_11340 [Cyanobacteriota/Melainabacteria group bacterium]